MSYGAAERVLPPIDTGAAAPFAMEQVMILRSILKIGACAAAVLALFGCASTSTSTPYQGNQGELPTAAGRSTQHPPYYGDRP